MEGENVWNLAQLSLNFGFWWFLAFSTPVLLAWIKLIISQKVHYTLFKSSFEGKTECHKWIICYRIPSALAAYHNSLLNACECFVDYRWMRCVILCAYLLKTLLFIASIEGTPHTWGLLILETAEEIYHEFMRIMLKNRVKLLRYYIFQMADFNDSLVSFEGILVK